MALQDLTVLPLSRLDCPVSLKTPNMGNIGLVRRRNERGAVGRTAKEAGLEDNATLRMSDKSDDGRVPIWSVPKGAMALYTAMFGSGWLWWVVVELPWAGVSVERATHNIASTTIACAGFALVATEVLWVIGGGFVVLGTAMKDLYDVYRRHRDDKLRQEGVREWLEWEKRRRNAKAHNMPFDEPPPFE